MLKTEFIQRFCISLVILLTSLDLYFNHGHYPAVKNVIDIVIIAQSVLFMFILLLAKNKGRYLFLIMAYAIVFGVYLPFLYQNSYATYNHLFTFWHLELCVVLMVISGLFYSVKHIIGMGVANVVLMGLAIGVLQKTDADYAEFNPVSVLMFVLFTVVLYLLCEKLKQQNTTNYNRIIEFDNKIELFQNEKKMLCKQAVVYDSYIQKLDETYKSVVNFIDTQFDGVNNDKARELKKKIRQNEIEMKQMSLEIKETETVSLINILRVKYPTITDKEAKVAVYTYYNHPDKVIARLTNLTDSSVARYRNNIKKKMDIDKVSTLKRQLIVLFDNKIEPPKPDTKKTLTTNK